MQYVGKVGGYVYNQWNSLNPATLSGAIDIIVIEHPDGQLQCSPWHVRFGKFQIIKPSQKKIDLYVNDNKTNLPMKLGEGGEAFFVFETDSTDLSSSMVTSPVISPQSSAEASPISSPRKGTSTSEDFTGKTEPEPLDLNQDGPNGNHSHPSDEDVESKINLSEIPPPSSELLTSPSRDTVSRLAFEKVKRITQQLNIPSKVDTNGDVILDMDGYKPNSQKNIDSSDKLVHDVFFKELENIMNGIDGTSPEGRESADADIDLLSSVVRKDKDGNLRIVYDDMEFDQPEGSVLPSSLSIPSEQSVMNSAPSTSDSDNKTYIKTLRLTSEQLSKMNLRYGRNRLSFKLAQGTSLIESDLYLWKSDTPIVISDIDGTITKSDALGHVLNMFGKDWTHPGVAKLFDDIKKNGYNIMYLTARSAGQADTTRQYLDSINQDGIKLPKGPVILSPDRTMAALRREIILKKPEVFKMACLRDIKSLFFHRGLENFEDIEDDRTPFYAGFGNRITDAISYRSVKIPSHRIFTINPNGEVHMELLELAGYKSSYLHIGELVDQFFPPLKYISDLSTGWNDNQLEEYIQNKGTGEDNSVSPTPGSPRSFASPGSPRSLHSDELPRPDERFTDLNYWREPFDNLSDLTDSESDTDAQKSKSSPPSPKLPSSPFSSPSAVSVDETKLEKPAKKERPISASFTSPLKNFMIRGGASAAEPKPMKSPMNISSTNDEEDNSQGEGEDDDYTDDYEDEDDDDYDDSGDDDGDDDEDEDEDEDDEEDEFYDEVDDEVDDLEGQEAEELDDEADEVDDEDIDLDDGLPEQGRVEARGQISNGSGNSDVKIMRASDLLKKLEL